MLKSENERKMKIVQYFTPYKENHEILLLEAAMFLDLITIFGVILT